MEEAYAEIRGPHATSMGLTLTAKFPVASPKCRAISPLQRSDTYVVSNGAVDESDIYKVQISAEGYYS